jgi:histidyl-tRNA synthetase
MAKLAAPRGTHDVLPDEWRLRQRALDVARRAFERYGYGRIATPTFEETAVFVRGVGEGSDIVRKEMYTFTDRSDRSLTLRPEGTAPVARAYVNAGMHRDPLPVKLWYYAPMFRYEKPQEGRYREHYQVGAEVFGSEHAAVDAEAIALLADIHRELGTLPHIAIHLNSIGDAECRPKYREGLLEYLTVHESELCDECRERMRVNPLRVLDCKNAGCQPVIQGAPAPVDHLCESCVQHFAEVQSLLAAAGVEFVLDPRLVRGLDYYTRTVFEFKTTMLGAQDAVGSGGRYDGLVEELGGPATPAVGFGCGIERLVLAMKAAGAESSDQTVDVYVAVADDARRSDAFHLAQQLRARGVLVEQDLVGRSIKGQMKQASRLRARFAAICEAGEVRLHAMEGRTESTSTYDGAVGDLIVGLADSELAPQS